MLCPYPFSFCLLGKWKFLKLILNASSLTEPSRAALKKTKQQLSLASLVMLLLLITVSWSHFSSSGASAVQFYRIVIVGHQWPNPVLSSQSSFSRTSLYHLLFDWPLWHCWNRIFFLPFWISVIFSSGFSFHPLLNWHCNLM